MTRLVEDIDVIDEYIAEISRIEADLATMRELVSRVALDRDEWQRRALMAGWVAP